MRMPLIRKTKTLLTVILLRSCHLSSILVKSMSLSPANTAAGDMASTVARAEPNLIALDSLLVKDAHLLF